MDAPIKVTIQDFDFDFPRTPDFSLTATPELTFAPSLDFDFPKTPDSSGGPCHGCYEPFSPIRANWLKDPSIPDLQDCGRYCPNCRAFVESFATAQRRSALPASPSKATDIRRGWAYWVNEFSQTKEDKNQDQIATLLGLTTFVQSLKQDEPLLGLWRDDIAEGLLWERGIWDQPTGKKRTMPFPSWTWMSLPGPVQYPSFSLTRKEIELLDTRIRWSHEPLYSTLKSAELLLRAKVLKGTLTWHGRESPQSSLYLDMGDSSKVALFERVDIPDSYYENATVRLILIGGTVQHWFFLIASVVNPERNPYVRIGRAYSPCNPKRDIYGKLRKHFATIEPQVLTLR